MSGLPSRRGGGEGKGRSERRLTCLGDVSQQQDGELLDLKSPKGRSTLEPYNHMALSYQWPADAV